VLVQVFSLPGLLGRSSVAAEPSIVTTMCSRTQPEIPPELVDRIIDFLHDQPKALAACSLVARSWTVTSQYHQFSTVWLTTPEYWTKFNRLIKISPTMICFIKSTIVDVADTRSPWMSVCATLTSLQHITMCGMIRLPWGSGAAAISSVAHDITSLYLNFTAVRRVDIWPIIRMFPKLVTLGYIGMMCLPGVAPLQLPVPSHSPPISSMSVTTATLGGILGILSDPPYPLTSLSALDISDVNSHGGGGLQPLARTYGGQISRLRLYVDEYQGCTSLGGLQPLLSC